MNTTTIMATGARSVALGVNDIPRPTGICTNPVSEELAKEIEKDPKNPINKCVFHKGYNLCYFGGECENRKELE